MLKYIMKYPYLVTIGIFEVLCKKSGANNKLSKCKIGVFKWNNDLSKVR